MLKKKKILFLCTGNSIRSQFAEVYGKIYLSEQFEIYSAGIENQGIDPRTIQVLEADGIDTAHLQARTYQAYDDIEFDYVITLCGKSDTNFPKQLKGAKRIFSGFMDPAAADNEDEIMKNFLLVRDLVKGYVKNVLPCDLR